MKLRIFTKEGYRPSSCGPKMFMSRLLVALRKNHNVEFTASKPHIALDVISLSSIKKCKHILRIDGCYYNKAMSGFGMNKHIANSIGRADAVIYQSYFSKKLCDSILKVSARKSAVIHNGIDQEWIKSIKPAQKAGDKVLVAVAAWRNSKRPKSIIKSFLKSEIPNGKLIFIGKFKKKIRHPDIIYTGKENQENIISYLKSADALIHLCKIESCSNTVVEALSCGVPVVCNNIGGTPELVGRDGVVANIDEFSFRPIKESNVDNVSRNKVAGAIKECLNKKWSVNRPNLDISETARQYYKFFLRVLDG